MIFSDGMMKILFGGRERIEVYKCPACGRRFDVEAVRRYTENGEAAVCMECGEQLVAVDGD